MGVVYTAEVPVFPTFRGFRTTVVREVDTTSLAASRTLGDRFRDGIVGAAKGVGVAVGATLAAGAGIAAAGVGAIFAKGLDRSLNIQDATKQLEGLGHSADSVKAIMTNALASVKGTAFGLDTAATIAATAVAAGIKPGQDLERTLKLTADAATIAKVPLGEMGDIFGKVASSGKLNTEVLNQFSQRGVPLLQFVAKHYGITADAAADMVSEGKVDFAAFQASIEENIAGAALKSGETARGAFANIGAAFGRMGAMFTQPAVENAPTLFQSIAAAVDRASAVLAPYAAQFATVLAPALAAMAAWIDTIDFNVVAEKVRGALGAVRDAVTGVVGAFQSGDFSGFSGTLGDIGAVVRPMFPLFVELGKGIGGIAGSVGEVIAAGFPLLVPILQGFADVLNFLGDNPALLAVAISAIAAAFLLSKAAVIGNSVAMAASIPLRYAEVATSIARTAALRANTAALIGEAAAERTSLASKVAGLGTTIASTAANVAARVAMVAGAVATGVATAAQWALNAALTANPIGIIIALIVALVAGLIWFFTQTELGQAIWAEFTRFLGEAWTNIVNVATTVFTALADFFGTIWNLIVTGITLYINLVRDIIVNVVTFIVTMWNAYWNLVFTVFSAIWNAIASFVSGVVNGISSAVVSFVNAVRTNVENVYNFVRDIPGKVIGFLGNLGKLLFNAGRDLIQGFIDGIKNMIGAVGKAIGGVMDFVGGFFPHSPAKRGQFSGSGWRQVREAGIAVGEQFGAGLDDASLGLNVRLASLAGVSSSSSSGGSSPASASDGTSKSDSTGAALIINGNVFTTSVDEFFDQAEREKNVALAAAALGGLS